jgi:drug/metabolite transporter (DMT)-like permease
MKTLPLIILSVFINASAQLLLKAGMNRIGYFNFSWANVGPITAQVIINPFIMIGLAFYVLAVVVWLLVLSRTDVSIAYPMISLAYVVNAIAAYYLFGENLSLMRMAGIGVILLGVYLIART